jgi:UDP-N-acetylglucosamine acyltransferase
MGIHPTAVIEPGAVIADGAEIGPFCVVGPHVRVGEDCRLGPHVHLAGHTTIGERTMIAPFVSLGTPPQSTSYRGGPTRLVIGSECDIREAVTMNTGTEAGGGITEIGSRCMLMAGSHVGHDCRVGNNVTLANNAVLGGHVTLGDFTFVGGNTAVHQFIRVGEGAMIGGMTGVTHDVIPYGFAFGQRAVLVGLNVVGLRRRGFSRAQIHPLRRAYRALFLGPGLFHERLATVAEAFASDPLVAQVIAFIAAREKRALMMPSAARSPADDDAS